MGGVVEGAFFFCGNTTQYKIRNLE